MSRNLRSARLDSPRSNGNNSGPGTPRSIRDSGNSLKVSGPPTAVASEKNDDDDGNDEPSLEQGHFFDLQGNVRDAYGYVVPEALQLNYMQWRIRTAPEAQKRGELFAHINDSPRFAYFDTDIQTLFKEGVPTHLRRPMWLQITGVGARIANNRGRYAALLARAEQDKSSKFYKDRTAIELDMERTFGENSKLNTAETVAKLRNVMLAYAKHNREFGYAHSMNFIVSALLLVNLTEEEAFWMFDYLMSMMPNCYDREFSGVVADIEVLDYYMEAKLKKLHEFLQTHRVYKEMYLTQMFMCLYVGYVPYEMMLCLWDRIMYGGIVELFRSALKFLNFIQAKIVVKKGADSVTIADAIISEHQALINPHEALALMPGSQPLEAGQLQFRRMRYREINKMKKREMRELTQISSRPADAEQSSNSIADIDELSVDDTNINQEK